MNKHLCKSWQITGNFIAHWSVSKLSALNHENKTDSDRFAVQNSKEENHQFCISNYNLIDWLFWRNTKAAKSKYILQPSQNTMYVLYELS